MFKTLKKDLKKRKAFVSYETLFLLINYLNNSKYYFKRHLYLSLDSLINSNTKVQFNCFCIVSGRSRAVFSRMRISRIVLKNFIESKVFKNFSKK
jgi:ribosomal protein S14